MSRDRFYRLKALEEVDNPDERITEDVKSYTQTTLSFFLMSLNAVITSLAFLGVLWSITPWLVLVAVIYAAAGSAMTIILGRPLVKLDNLQLQKEADLRYHLIQTRETAEAIATMGAGRTARDCLHSRLKAVVQNNKRIIAVTRNLGLFTNGYNYLTQLIPLVIVAPMYMQGYVEFGVVTQAAMAFATFLSGFSLIVTQFETLSSFVAVTTRLDTIAQALEQARSPATSPIQVSHDENRVGYENLSLWSRHERHPLINDLTLEIVHGSNLLITGPDTAAEEALFMATAEFWDQGKGRIIRPGRDGIYFVPTQPLTVRCTVRSQLTAGTPDRRFSDEEILAVLEKVGLAAAIHRLGGLDADVHTPHRPLPGRAAPAHLRPGPAGASPLRLPRPHGSGAQPGADREDLPPAQGGVDQLSEHRRCPSARGLPRQGAGHPRRGAMGGHRGRRAARRRRAGRRAARHRYGRGPSLNVPLGAEIARRRQDPTGHRCPDIEDESWTRI